MLKRIKRLLPAIVLMMALFSCKEETPAPVKMEFPGIVFTDELGDHLGTYGGTDDNDWDYDPTWPDEVWDAINYIDAVSLAGTFLESSYQPPGKIPFTFFPNPVSLNASAYIIVPGTIKVKMVMVDQFLNVIAANSYIGSDTSRVTLDLSDTSRFVEGELYRLYYTFSVSGNEHFYKGHGDVLICSLQPTTLCLDYLDE